MNSEKREAYEEHLKWLRIEANTLKKIKGDTRKIKNISKAMLKEGMAIFSAY